MLYNPFKVMVYFVLLIFEDFLTFINERYWSIVFLWYFCLVLDQSNSDIVELVRSVRDKVTLWIVLDSKCCHNTILRQGGSNNSHLISHSARCWKSKFKMLQVWFLLQSCFLACIRPLIAISSRGLSLCVHITRHLRSPVIQM